MARNSTLQNAVSATGDGTSLSVGGMTTAFFGITGTFTATVTFEATHDDSNWFSIVAHKSTGASSGTTTTSTGLYCAALPSGVKQVRARVTWTSGTSITVVGSAGMEPFPFGWGAPNTTQAALGSGDQPSLQVKATGGSSGYDALSTAAVLSAEIKSGAGTVYDLDMYNNGANEVFFRLYDQTGAPAAGDTDNIVYRGMIPGNAAGAGVARSFFIGRAFATGIGIRVTGGVADDNTTALAANEVMVNVGFK